MSKIDLVKLSQLAQIPLKDKEMQTLTPQLERVLDFVKQVSDVPTISKTSKSSSSLSLDNLREDKANSERSLSAQEALSNAASHDGSSFVVKGIFE